MKNLNLHIERAIFASLLFICISFPLSFTISNIGLVFLVASWLLKVILVDRKIAFTSAQSRNLFIASSLLFLWQSISLFYSEDLVSGLKNLEGKMSLILLPLILLTISMKENRVLLLLKAYILSIGICSIVLMVNSGVNYFQTGLFLTYHDFTAMLGFHAVFYSYYTYLAILISAFLFNAKALVSWEKLILIFLLGLFFTVLVISASKNVLIVSTLSLFIILSYQLIKNKITWKTTLLVGSILVIVSVAFVSSPNIQKRLSELGSFEGIENLEKVQQGEILSHEDRLLFNGTSLRIFLWVTGAEIVAKNDAQLIGLTPADRRAIINEEYYKNGMNPSYENFNLHNQFVQTYVELGLVGLVLYLSIIGIAFLIALKNKNQILLLFLSAFVVFQITESVLERNKGIVFFMFFIFFLQQLRPSQNENRDNRN